MRGKRSHSTTSDLNARPKDTEEVPSLRYVGWGDAGSAYNEGSVQQSEDHEVDHPGEIDGRGEETGRFRVLHIEMEYRDPHLCSIIGGIWTVVGRHGYVDITVAVRRSPLYQPLSARRR